MQYIYNNKEESYKKGEVLRLVSEIPPSVNHYMGHRAIIRNGKPISVNYTTKEADKYKSDFTKYVIEQAREQGWNLPVNKYQHFYIDTLFYFDRTDRDPNNYYKVPLDAITAAGVIWEDDNVTCERVQGIYYDPENPRVEMIIHPVDYIGVFRDASQLAEFKEANCVGCTRYKRNCSILKNAVGGRIQKEVKDGACEKCSRTEKGEENEKE